MGKIRTGWGRLRSTGVIVGRAAQLAGQKVLGREVDPEGTLGEALARELDSMKGVAMKVGQILSYFDGVLPAPTHEALRRLQLGVAQLPFHQLRDTVERAFGEPLASLFERFEEAPVAAASIGQVHRASLRGAPVAVKVQYPKVRETLSADVSRLRAVSKVASLATEVDGPAVVAELAERFVQECDYEQEARNLIAFRDAFAGEAWALIPAPHLERTRPNVLTTDWCDGRGFYDFAAHASQEEKDAVGLLLARFALRSLYGRGFINADPHPGNYLFPGRGQVVFLDFGCVRRFEPAFFQTQRELTRVVVADRRAHFRDALLATGMVPHPDRFDFDLHWELLTLQLAPYRTPRFRFTPELVRRGMELSRPNNPNLRRLAIPPQWIWSTRLLFGLHAVLARLQAEGPFAREMEAALAA